MNKNIFHLFSFVILSTVFITESLAEENDNELNSGGNSDNILDWSAPYELQKNFPYFLSGFSKQGDPVWVWEFGAWDFKNEAEKSGEHSKTLKKYSRQMFHRFQESANHFNQSNIILIVELAGFDLRQAASYAVIDQIVELARVFVRLNNEQLFVEQVLVINANFVAHSVYNLIRPILGHYQNIIQLFGTNEASWKPTILRGIERDQIPSWIGGSQNHKPLKIYG